MCIDSDDYMPDDAVEKIIALWRKYYPTDVRCMDVSPVTSRTYCGIQGLDFNVVDGQPIGGKFPEKLDEVFLHELHLKKVTFWGHETSLTDGFDEKGITYDRIRGGEKLQSDIYDATGL